MTPYQADVDAMGGDLFATAMVSTIPLLVVFVFLGLLKTRHASPVSRNWPRPTWWRYSPADCRMPSTIKRSHHS